ncbi:cytochrome P450 CYP72A219-like [Coffea eugenioides]|uniref:cytochrome P450 CYP72A219-like n=1 Tax=Coffea eugenioides TaxID=49369 RepID=UPI000F60CBC8|nr:cytochrome P450 CYP72A219-like [Coffea eugenioides]
METTNLSTFPVYSSCLLLLLLLAVIVSWKVLNWVWFRPKKLEKRLKEQGFRGNPYKRLHGDFKDISALYTEAHSKNLSLSDDIVPRVIPEYLEAVKKYGKNTYLWFGPTPAVVIVDPNLMKEITQKVDVFPKPRLNAITKLLVQGVVTYEGEKWAKHRKLLNPAFHVEKLKLMLPAFYKSASEMVTKWENVVSPKGLAEVDVWPNLQALTSDAISRTAFGSNYEEGRRIFELQREQTEHLMQLARSVYINIPGYRFLPTKRSRRMKQIAREVNGSVREMINTRRKAMRAGEAGSDDLLGLMLQSNSQEIEKHGNKDSGMTTEEIVDECKLFYFAGQETTSALLVWTMVLLCRYPEWQARAREEVLQQFGTKDPDFDGLNHLKIVTMILHEVLRLCPPLATMSRRTIEETKLGNLTLPAGVQITLPIMLMHHDPDIWGEDVKQFKPERFAEGVSHATKGQVAYFPFSWGPRTCIGQNFAMLEAKLAMSMILQRFSFELSPSYTHAPRTGTAISLIQPQYGAHLILQKII